MKLQKILESVEFFFDKEIIESFPLNPRHSEECQQGREMTKIIKDKFKGNPPLFIQNPYSAWIDHLSFLRCFQNQEEDKILIDPDYGYEINQGVILEMDGEKIPASWAIHSPLLLPKKNLLASARAKILKLDRIALLRLCPTGAINIDLHSLAEWLPKLEERIARARAISR